MWILDFVRTSVCRVESVSERVSGGVRRGEGRGVAEIGP